MHYGEELILSRAGDKDPDDVYKNQGSTSGLLKRGHFLLCAAAHARSMSAFGAKADIVRTRSKSAKDSGGLETSGLHSRADSREPFPQII
jgi:hypothetical protein